MNKVVLGTVQFGVNYGINNAAGQVPLEEVCKILKLAEAGGVKTLDTSAGYGQSELVLGKAMKESQTHFNIVSKYPKTNRGVRETFMESLRQLGVESVYGYLVHLFKCYEDNPSIFDEMTALKREGKIERIGFSLYRIDQLQLLLDKKVNFDILQFPYNIFDRQFEQYMPQLVDMGVEIHTRSAFLQGLFFKDVNTLPDKLIPLKPYLEKLHQYSDKEGVSIEQIAFGYVLANDYVKGALIGVDNHAQLEANLKVASQKLKQKDIDFIKTLEIKEKELLNPVNWN
jgi:aryl-alcohol dehydrogenase-like predicted oxidoreductase